MTLRELAWDSRRYRDWYLRAQDAIEWAAPKLGCTPHDLAHVLAATSIRSTVQRNTKLAIAYFREGLEGPVQLGMLPVVYSVLEEWKLNGTFRSSARKISAFAENLSGNPWPVALDVWMSRLLGLPKRLSDIYYGKGSRQVRRTADSLKWTPAECQAALWCGVILQHGRTPVSLAGVLKQELSQGRLF